MKVKSREKWLILGAGGCLLIAVSQFVFSNRSGASGNSENAPAANLNVQASADPLPEVQSERPDEFYKQIRKQLQQVIPAHADPFVYAPRPATSPSNLRMDDNPPLTVHATGWGLAPLPKSGMEEREKPAAKTGEQTDRRTERSNHSENWESGVGSEEPLSNSPSATPPHELTTSPPVLKGLVRDANTGEAQVALEWNRQIVIATTDPQGDWVILELSNEKLIVQHGDHQYTIQLSEEGLRDRGQGSTVEHL